MSDSDHIAALSGRLNSNEFRDFVAYEPLTPVEFRELSDNATLSRMEDTKLQRLWITPVSRWLQQKFRIDQRGYSSSTIPTLSQLAEDFSVATAICIDKFALNEDQLTGQASVGKAGSHRWDHVIPPRVTQLLARYDMGGGGRVTRG